MYQQCFKQNLESASLSTTCLHLYSLALKHALQHKNCHAMPCSIRSVLLCLAAYEVSCCKSTEACHKSLSFPTPLNPPTKPAFLDVLEFSFCRTAVCAHVHKPTATLMHRSVITNLQLRRSPYDMVVGDYVACRIPYETRPRALWNLKHVQSVGISPVYALLQTLTVYNTWSGTTKAHTSTIKPHSRY